MPFTICIDPGHGGKDTGAIDGKENDALYTKEADINLKVALLLTERLRAKGYNVVLTRASDWYPTLKERIMRANQAKADLFLSLHCNAAVNERATGIETLYHPSSKNGKRFAELIQQEVIKHTKAASRGVKARKDLAVLNGTNMPSALLEMGFITNNVEEYKLNDPAYQALIVTAIEKAIERYRKGESA